MSKLKKVFPNNLLTVEFEKYLELPYHVYLKNSEGTFLGCNTIYAEFSGFIDPADVVGTNDKDYISESEFNVINSNDKKIFYTETPSIMVESVAAANHPLCSYLSYKMPVRSLTGALIGIFGISIAQNSEMFSALLLNSQQSFATENRISKREKECLNYLIMGMTAKEIARALNISHRTIEFYIEKMKQKFHCANRIELIAKAFDLVKTLS